MAAYGEARVQPKTPHVIIDINSTELAGRLISIDRSEKPVYAIAMPAIAVGTPPAIAKIPNHLGN